MAEVTALSRGGGGDPPGYVAAIAADARPLPTRPPTRPLAAGSCARRAPARLLFPGRTESGSVSPLRTLAAASFSPPRPQLLASPAPRRAGESAVAAAGKGCGPAALAHSTTRPGPRRPRSRGSEKIALELQMSTVAFLSTLVSAVPARQHMWLVAVITGRWREL